MNPPRQDPQASTRVLFIRHGEAESNATGKYMGSTDSPLTDLGRRQVNAVARRLSRFSIDALYSSDRGRTMETATVISSACARRVSPDSRLREQDFGRFEGLTVDEILQAYPDEYAEHKRRGPETAAHGGESSLQVRDRVASFVDEIVGRHPGETVGVVSHGGAMAVTLWGLLEIPYEVTKHVRVGNTGLVEFVRKEDRWILERWNDTGHLDGLLSE